MLCAPRTIPGSNLPPLSCLSAYLVRVRLRLRLRLRFRVRFRLRLRLRARVRVCVSRLAVLSVKSEAPHARLADGAEVNRALRPESDQHLVRVRVG
eukprot:scaffold43924_cov61-Phaeocystis_antarctica.AAC.4